MRNISPASLAKMSELTGIEPINIIEIQWQTDGGRLVYGDRKIPGVDGRILTLDGIEEVINVSKSGINQSVSMTLSDHDGHLKNIFDNNDVHKKKVWIYQYFEGLPLSEKFLIFNGVIVSPVTWKEGDRTLSFSVITKTEDIEIGFSAEDGQFPNLPQTLVGKVWPLCFGTCFKVPCVLIDDILNRPDDDDGNKNQGDSTAASTADDVGIADPSLGPKITDNDKSRGNLLVLAQLYFIGYLQASHTARKRGELGDLDDISKGKGKYSSLAQQYLQLGNKALADAQKVLTINTNLKTIQSKQKTYEKPEIKVTDGSGYIQGKTINLNIGGSVHTGYFLGDTFYVTERKHPASEKFNAFLNPGTTFVGQPTIDRETFFYVPSGFPLKLSITPKEASEDGGQDDFIAPTRYLVAGSIAVTVTAVFAYRNINGARRLSLVPFNYFSVFQTMYGTLPATMIVMRIPLSARERRNGESEGWEDEIWANVVSNVGPNTVDILIWLIETYTTATYDETSFASVRNDLTNYPSNFAIFDRPNVFQALADIAYQARCIIWLKDDKFYIKYLAKKDTSVDTITEDDIEEGSLEVSYTETEDVHTKIIAQWKSTYRQTKPNLVILRYNTDYYGVQENTVDWFIYTQQQLVAKSATFWLIREANTYKRITFKVGIDKLNLETMDTITLDFNNKFIANGPIDCVIEEAKFDSNDYSITITCWCPVRAGEMTEYIFAYPANLDTQYVFPTPEDIASGRAGTGKRTPYNNNVQLPTPQPNVPEFVEQPFTGDPGTGGTINKTTRPVSWGVDPSYLTDIANAVPEILTRLNNPVAPGSSTKPAGTTDYLYESSPDQTPVTPTVEDESLSSTFPGIITEASIEDGYTVDIYEKGMDNEPTTVRNVLAPQMPPEPESEDEEPELFSIGTGVLVAKISYTNDEGEEIEEYYMQPPVWQ